MLELSRFQELASSSAANITTVIAEPSSTDSNLTFLVRVRNTTQSVMVTRRPLQELVNFSSFSCPLNYGDAMARIHQNVGYFYVNYTIVMLFILFVSLLWHPISMIVFLIIFIAWFFLYFFHDEPIVIFGKTIDDRWIMLGLLSLITIIAPRSHQSSTKVGLNVLVLLINGVVLVGLHSHSDQSLIIFSKRRDQPTRDWFQSPEVFHCSKPELKIDLILS